MNTFIIYFDKGGNLERRYMQNTINIAKELVDTINNIGIEKNKTNLYIFDNNNMIKKVYKIKGLQVGGSGGIVVAHKNTSFSEVNCCFKNGGVAIFDESRFVITKLKVYINHESSIFYIGKNFSCVSASCYLYEGKGIYIGDDNQWSFGIQIRNSDAHAIIDIKTEECLNYGRDVIIGKHVWIASNCIILKGACIRDNTVIGAGSVVTKDFMEENCVLAGNPAKLVKRDISWSRKSPMDYK